MDRPNHRLLVTALLVACSSPPSASAPAESPAPAPAEAPALDARHRFFAEIGSLCGRRLEGRTVYMVEPRPPFAGARLLMEVASCGESEIRIPFQVGEERSRTWVLTRSPEGLLLEHDHRHEDGTPEDLTGYGGWATADGSRYRQRFPAHEATARMLPEAETNVWTLEIRPSEGIFVYELDRHDAPRFRAHFDL